MFIVAANFQIGRAQRGGTSGFASVFHYVLSEIWFNSKLLKPDRTSTGTVWICANSDNVGKLQEVSILAGGLFATLEFHASAKTECDMILAATCAFGMKGDIQPVNQLETCRNRESLCWIKSWANTLASFSSVSAYKCVHYCSKLVKSLKPRTQGMKKWLKNSKANDNCCPRFTCYVRWKRGFWVSVSTVFVHGMKTLATWCEPIQSWLQPKIIASQVSHTQIRSWQVFLSFQFKFFTHNEVSNIPPTTCYWGHLPGWHACLCGSGGWAKRIGQLVLQNQLLNSTGYCCESLKKNRREEKLVKGVVCVSPAISWGGRRMIETILIDLQ